MPFAKLPNDELDAIARKVLDQLQRSDNHPIPSTQGMTFAQIERRSRQVAQAVATHLTAEALGNARVVPLADIAANVEHTWSSRLLSDRFILQTELGSSVANSAIFVDARVLDQVLGNLIDNARKYAKHAEDRRISVLIRADGPKQVSIDVQDHGPGVPAAERKAIFKPFTRGSAACETGGAGLGLSLAKEWAELFGGTLEYVASHPGACFRLSFPVRDAG